MVTCSRCGQENPEGFAFCGACAAPLAPTEPARDVRKVVTVVFSDVTGSTALGEQLDPESLRRVMGRYFDEMQSVVESHEGTVEKFIGDAVMAVFGIPVLHEDDALRAVRAASEMRERLAALNEELERDWGVTIAVRTGVNTGEVVAGDGSEGQRFATGDAVNVAKRFEEAAPPGEVLLGETTYRLVRDAVEVEPTEPLGLKGKSEAVRAYRLVTLAGDLPGRARRLDSPMVGRERELAALEQAYQRAVGERACLLFTVLGAAGVGKSRLIAEFLAGVGGEATVMRGRCLPYGEGITYWPLAEALRGRYGEEPLAGIGGVLSGDEAPLITERIAAAIDLGENAGAPDETAWAVRRLFEAEGRARPLVVLFDDLQWAEPTFLDLVEHLADWAREAPILLICLARPEFLDERPSWGGGKFNATSVLLERLSDGESVKLVANLLGRAQLDETVRDRIMSAAEGNPLFVEEMLAMLIDDGLLTRNDGHWEPAGDLTKITVPPTIHALLSARLDRLGRDERAVIERGSVEGKVFHRGAVAQLSTDDLRKSVWNHLQTLVRKELIRPDRTDLPGEDAFRFRHLLIRDAAYEAMPKELRAELHARFADWLEQIGAEHLAERDEIIGYHLEQAYRYRTELAPVDDETQELALRGGRKARGSRPQGGAPIRCRSDDRAHRACARPASRTARAARPASLGARLLLSRARRSRRGAGSLREGPRRRGRDRRSRGGCADRGENGCAQDHARRDDGRGPRRPPLTHGRAGTARRRGGARRGALPPGHAHQLDGWRPERRARARCPDRSRARKHQARSCMHQLALHRCLLVRRFGRRGVGALRAHSRPAECEAARPTGCSSSAGTSSVWAAGRTKAWPMSRKEPPGCWSSAERSTRTPTR